MFEMFGKNTRNFFPKNVNASFYSAKHDTNYAFLESTVHAKNKKGSCV